MQQVIYPVLHFYIKQMKTFSNLSTMDLKSVGFLECWQKQVIFWKMTEVGYLQAIVFAYIFTLQFQSSFMYVLISVNFIEH